MITIEGYTALDHLYGGTGTTVYRGYDNRVKRTAVLKEYLSVPDLDIKHGTGFNITFREISPKKRE